MKLYLNLFFKTQPERQRLTYLVCIQTITFEVWVEILTFVENYQLRDSQNKSFFVDLPLVNLVSRRKFETWFKT